MSDTTPIVKVQPWGKGQGDFVEINAADYDPAIHTLIDGEPAPFNGADPAAFDHDGDGEPGGSEPGPELTPGAIPADWEALHWKRRVKLAEEIAGRELEGEALGDQANDIIAAEVARLAAVDVQDGPEA